MTLSIVKESIDLGKDIYMTRHSLEAENGSIRCSKTSSILSAKSSISYHLLWNGFKKIMAEFSEDEKDRIFSGTATRVYNV